MTPVWRSILWLQPQILEAELERAETRPQETIGRHEQVFQSRLDQDRFVEPVSRPGADDD